MASDREQAFYNIEEISYYSVATTLDLLFRQKYFKSAAYSGAAINVIKSMNFDFEDEIIPITQELGPSASKRPRLAVTTATSSSWEGLDNEGNISDSETEAPSMTLNEKLEDYLKLKNVYMDLNPLIWWKENKTKYPKLAKIARIYLSAPAGNQSSESAFLVAKNICGGKRGSLLPENTRMLHFLKCNLPAVRFNVFHLA